MRLIATATAAAALLTISGCAATLHPRSTQVADAGACSALERASKRDMWLAIGEATVGSVAGLAIVTGAGPLQERPGRGEVVMFALLGTAVIQAASADQGFKRARECRGVSVPLTATR